MNKKKQEKYNQDSILLIPVKADISYCISKIDEERSKEKKETFGVIR